MERQGMLSENKDSKDYWNDHIFTVLWKTLSEEWIQECQNQLIKFEKDKDSKKDAGKA